MQKHFIKYKAKIIKYLVGAIILAIPLYPKFPFLKIPGTYVAIRIEDFLIFTAVVVISLLQLYDNKLKVVEKISSIFHNKVSKSIVLFWGITLVSLISGIIITQTVTPHIGILHWGRRIEYMLMFFVGLSSVKSREDLVFYLKCFLLVVLTAFVFGIGQKYFNWPVITTQNSEYSQGVALRYMPGGHLVTTFAGHYDLATFLILISPLLYILAAGNIKKHVFFNEKKTKILLFSAIGAGFWLLVNAASRISVVSYLISVCLGLFLIKKYKYIPVVIVVCAIFVAFSTNLIDRYSRIFQVTVEKVFQKGNPIMYVLPKVEVLAQETLQTPQPQPQVFEDRSTSIRLNVEWPRAVRAFSKNPFLGTGFSSITLATDNDYLRLLGEVGILGILSFLLIFFHLVIQLIKKIKYTSELTIEKAFRIGVFSCLPGIFLNAFFIDIFESSKFAILFWLILGIALARLPKNNEKNI